MKTLKGTYSEHQLMDVAMQHSRGFCSLQSASWTDDGLEIIGRVSGDRTAALTIPTSQAVAELNAIRDHENKMFAANGGY